MSINRRKDERINFHMDRCDGSFFVTDHAGNEVEVISVNDVSISGVGLQLKQTAFDIDDKIRLIYETDGLRIAIYGLIRWYTFVSHNDGCRVGLQFEPGQGDMNLLFFMALREYLDSFDHVSIKEQS